MVAVAGPPDNDRVVGFATVAAGSDDGAELEDLFVDPGWRRRGIARHLVRHLADAARDTGHRRLWVTGNPHALAFYLAVGLVRVDGDICVIDHGEPVENSCCDEGFGTPALDEAV